MLSSFSVARSQASDCSIIGPPWPSHSMLSAPVVTGVAQDREALSDVVGVDALAERALADGDAGGAAAHAAASDSDTSFTWTWLTRRQKALQERHRVAGRR